MYKSRAWFCFQLAPNTHKHPCPKGWPHKRSSCRPGRGEEGRSRSCLLCQGQLAEGKPHQREGISLYPVGMHSHFHLLPGHRSSSVFHHPNPGHHEVREMLLPHFAGIPLPSNYCLVNAELSVVLAPSHLHTCFHQACNSIKHPAAVVGSSRDSR